MIDFQKTKICHKCKQDKHISLFFKDKNLKDGYEGKCKECRRKYKNSIREKVIESNQKYYIRNKKKILECNRNYDKSNREKVRIYKRKYQNGKYKNDFEYKIKRILRSRLYDALIENGGQKFTSSLNLIGCSIIDCKQYLEKLFLPEMTWENYGKIWEIDHKKACANFDLTKLEEQQICFHYKNLQPLFKTTEIAKLLGYKDQIGNRNKSNK